MQSKATYKIRKNGKQDVFEGSLEDVRKWLRQNSVNSSDAMRREGYQVLELDEFWGLVKDFPEIGDLTEREGRAALVGRFRTARQLLIAGVLLMVAGLGLMLYSQWLPRYQESLDRVSYEQKVAEAQRQAKELIERERLAAAQALKDSTDRMQEISAQKADREKSADDLRGELANTRQALAKTNGELRTTRTEVEMLKQTLASLKRERDDVAAKFEQVSSQLSAKTRRIPINVSWRDALIGQYKVMVIRNHSESPLELSLVIKCQNGDVLARDLVIQPGFSAETGRGEKVNHEFKEGEQVTVSIKDRPGDFDPRTFVAE